MTYPIYFKRALLKSVILFTLMLLSNHALVAENVEKKTEHDKNNAYNQSEAVNLFKESETTLLANQVRSLVASVKKEAIFHRRHLHQFPELSFQEYETSKYIRQVLSKYKIEFEEVANTGVIATVKGTKSPAAHTVILRADIDALPIDEKNDIDFKSRNKGVMHACGHDFHTANLLAVLKILTAMKSSFSGTVIGIFQPAEEKLPGGAIAVIESGKLPVNSSNIKGVLGLHVAPEIQAGKVAVKAGQFLASTDGIFIKIKGKGGHGARPQDNIDPVVITSQLILSLQQIVSRSANPFIPSVLSFGKVIADGSTNIIPNEVYIEGTFRTMDDAWRAKALNLIERQVKSLPQMYGATVELEIKKGYPPVVNDEQLAYGMKSYMKEYLTDINVEEAVPMMVSEDFAYYTQRYPAVMYAVGVGNIEKGITAAVHTANFQIDEDAFDASIGTMVYNTLKLLEK